MKIRYVTYARIPTRKANGLQISKTCEALAARGVDVELVIPGKNRHSREERTENIFEFYSLKRNFRVVSVWVPPFLPLGNFGIFLQNIYFFIVVGISSIFVSKDTIVYFRQPLMVVPALIFGRKAVFESHEGRWTLAIRLAVALGLRIITLTKSSVEKYAVLGMSRDKLAAVPDAVDLSLFSNLPSKDECRKIYGIDRDVFVAMYTGSFGLYGWKGSDVFLDASNKTDKQITFYAVGATKKEISDFKATGKYSKVVFVEEKPHTERPMILNAADVLIVPNKKGDEVSELHTSPIKLFEYLAAGKPIVASKLPSLLEVLNKDNAVIIEPNDALALAQGIERLYADNGLVRRLGEASRALSRRYSWDERAREIEESINHFYEKL